MRAASELPIPNLFLASLSEDDFEALRPHFEMVRLPLRQIVHVNWGADRTLLFHGWRHDIAAGHS